jgi:hypothetical protein
MAQSVIILNLAVPTSIGCSSFGRNSSASESRCWKSGAEYSWGTHAA